MIEYIGALNAALSITDRLKKNRSASSLFLIEDNENSVSDHLRYVARWCSDISVGGGARNFELDDVFVRLVLQRGQTRARQHNIGQKAKRIIQDDIFVPGAHKLVLGGPGAGKTTLLRFAAHYVLTQEQQQDADIIDFPIVVECRSLRSGETLVERICRIIGISIFATSTMPRTAEVRRQELDRRRQAVTEFLNEASVLLLVDGLDEVSVFRRTELVDELNELCRRVEESTIIITCRFGALDGGIAGALTYGIQDFCPEDVEVFCRKWFGPRTKDSNDFLQQLRRSTYEQLSRTPLQLANLCLVFDTRGTLPESPISIYETILLIRLEKWDRERGIVRQSQYGRKFDAMEKKRFLAALAFRLAKGENAARFDTPRLVKEYSVVGPKFGLPANQATNVIQEIESHTGILVQVDDDVFEFYHLSMFEYLCADYLSRSQISQFNFNDFLPIPEPAAIACGLSADADIFLLMLAKSIARQASDDEWSSKSYFEFWTRFFTRLSGDRIIIPDTAITGYAIFTVMATRWWEDQNQGGRIKERVRLREIFKNVRQNINSVVNLNTLSKALKAFAKVDVRRDYVILYPADRWPHELLTKPKRLLIGRDVYDRATLRCH